MPTTKNITLPLLFLVAQTLNIRRVPSNMKKTALFLSSLALSVPVIAQGTDTSEKTTEETKVIEKVVEKAKDAMNKPVKSEAEKAAEKELLEKNKADKILQEKLQLKNSISAEQLKAELAAKRAEVAKLKLERELLKEQFEMSQLQRSIEKKKENDAFEDQQITLQREVLQAKAESDKALSQLKKQQSEWSLETMQYKAQIEQLKTSKLRKQFTEPTATYPDEPLKDNVLTISDRRISLNGPITLKTADYITERISFYNNTDKKKPIFIVIDSCPGGSVMSGYRILKAMEVSDAPIHVVVKSYAASMAACITTLADDSYALPNSVILHHQISLTFFLARLNLTQQKEMYEDSKKWWNRLAQPIADKMGITLDEFIEQMYENDSSGDWAEFGEEAQKLKWVNTIIDGVKETSITSHPELGKTKPNPLPSRAASTETRDAEGQPVMYLPRLTPHDYYFMHNPDGYYRIK